VFPKVFKHCPNRSKTSLGRIGSASDASRSTFVSKLLSAPKWRSEMQMYLMADITQFPPNRTPQSFTLQDL
jgi:hypothetical protein